jgi:SAM-dependent methyltransferase
MSRQRAQQLASEFLACADPTGWFEVLYAEAGSNYAAVPWADLAPNPNLVAWVTKHNLVGKGRTALKIGCGYGDDAEFLAGLGFQVVAFDISPTAISEGKRRFPNSQVSYQVADLLKPPDTWFKSFNFVLESTLFKCYRLSCALSPSQTSVILLHHLVNYLSSQEAEKNPTLLERCRIH